MFHGYTFYYPEDALIKWFVIIRHTHICQNYKGNNIMCCILEVKWQVPKALVDYNISALGQHSRSPGV